MYKPKWYLTYINKPGNREMKKQYMRKYNAGLGWIKQKEWREKNKEKCRELAKQWRIKNHDRILLMKKVYNFRRRKNGRVKLKTIQLVYEDNIKKYGTLTCYLCLKPIEFGKDSIDHKIPISRGGNHNYENLEIAHLKCNYKKHLLTYDEWKKKEDPCLS